MFRLLLFIIFTFTLHIQKQVFSIISLGVKFTTASNLQYFVKTPLLIFAWFPYRYNCTEWYFCVKAKFHEFWFPYPAVSKQPALESSAGPISRLLLERQTSPWYVLIAYYTLHALFFSPLAGGVINSYWTFPERAAPVWKPSNLINNQSISINNQSIAFWWVSEPMKWVGNWFPHEKVKLVFHLTKFWCTCIPLECWSR